MLFRFLLFAGAAAAAPFALKSGFPNPSASQLATIQKEAGGTLPNTALPTSLKPDAILSLQVIAVNEIFEVAYFDSLLKNVTNNVEGYTDLGAQSKEYVTRSLKRIRAQEELHAIGANAILASAGASTIGPCNYMFPVTTYKSAIELASTFTDLVLGTLQVVNQGFALDGGQAASGLVPLLSSIVGQEGEQDGAYRLIGNKVPSASPFLTSGGGAFAFNAVAQLFLVPNSCSASSNVSQIALPTFAPLTLASNSAKPCDKNETLTLTTTADVTSSDHVAYISGQNSPVVVPISNIKKSGKSTTFKVLFPFDSGFSNGLTIGALVKSAGPFENGAAVANATIAGPFLAEVN